MYRIGILAFDNCQPSSVTIPLDMFHIANTVWGHLSKAEVAPVFEWKILSPGGKPVRAASGLCLAADGDLALGKDMDAVIMPGSHFWDEPTLLLQLQQCQDVIAAIEAYAASGVMLAAQCNATFLLAEANVIKDKRVTTSWWISRLFAQRYPDINVSVDELVVEDKNILSCGAGTAGSNLSLKIIEKFCGVEFALDCAKVMLIDANRVAQTSFMTLQSHQRHNDALISKAQSWMHKNIHKEFTLNDLASVLAVSERTFIRRFKQATKEKPKQYLQRLRIETAKRLLETTNLTIEAVIEKVGYSDLSSFRRLFKKYTTLSPREYRQRFAFNDH